MMMMTFRTSVVVLLTCCLDFPHAMIWGRSTMGGTGFGEIVLGACDLGSADLGVDDLGACAMDNGIWGSPFGSTVPRLGVR